jgi:hypothetical protein
VDGTQPRHHRSAPVLTCWGCRPAPTDTRFPRWKRPKGSLAAPNPDKPRRVYPGHTITHRVPFQSRPCRNPPGRSSPRQELTHWVPCRTLTYHATPSHAWLLTHWVPNPSRTHSAWSVLSVPSPATDPLGPIAYLAKPTPTNQTHPTEPAISSLETTPWVPSTSLPTMTCRTKP